MRIALLHNEEAGAALTLSQIREAIEAHGHQIVRVVENETDSRRLLDDRADLVVAAGGDGTVAVAARVLSGQGLPLTMLPLGTANNVASSLGLDDDLNRLIGGWDSGRRRSFDLGVCTAAWGETVFLESVGHGLIATGINTMQGQAPDPNEPTASRIVRAIRTYREVLSTLNPTPLRVTLDGRRMDGEFLLLEILNTPSIGPNLVLTRDADPTDGWFSVVMAQQEHGDELRAYLDLKREGSHDYPSLSTERARQIEIDGAALIHVDGEIKSLPGRVSVRIDVSALEFLV